MFSKEEDIFLKRLENITYHLASPRAQPEVAHTRGRRMSRGTDMIDQSYRARRETYAKPRRPRDFLSRTIKGWTMFEVASRRRAAPVPSIEEVSDFGIILLPMIRTVPVAELALITVNRLTDPESYNASLDLPQRQPDVSATRTMPQVAWILLKLSVDASMPVSVSIAPVRYRLR